MTNWRTAWKPKEDLLQERLKELQEEEMSWWEKPFHWLSENVEKPIASVMLSPFSPSFDPTQMSPSERKKYESMSWWERERFEYDVWDAPWGVKGATELGSTILLGGAVAKGLKGASLLATGVKSATQTVKGFEFSAETAQSIKNFKNLVPEIKTALRAQKGLMKPEKGSRMATYKSLIKEIPEDAPDYLEQAAAIRKTVFSGKYEKIPLVAAQKISGRDIDNLAKSLRTLNAEGKIGDWKWFNAHNGLERLQLGIIDPLSASKPQLNQVKLLSQIFGGDFGKAVDILTSTQWERMWRGWVNLMNLPRSTLASTDLSHIARQCAPLLTSHPEIVMRTASPAFKALFKGKYYDEIMDEVRRFKTHKIAKGAGVEFTELGSITRGEEGFMSSWASKIFPFVRGSERGYVGGLNLARGGYFDWAYPKMKAIGESKWVKDLGTLTNCLTGRGSLPSFLKNSTGFLNLSNSSLKCHVNTNNFPFQCKSSNNI